MRIAIAVMLFVIAFSADIKSQDILLLPNQTGDSTKHPDKTFIVIKGEEIRRFPSANFIDAVNGFFPWVFTPYSKINDFSFVVNGFMLADINSISLNDIDEIIFSRNNLYGSQFPFSKAGTFFIKTRTAQSRKLEINFNSQFNHSWNKERFVPATGFGIFNNPVVTSNASDNRPGYFISNHLSLGSQGKKLGVLFSAQINSERSVEVNQNTIFRFPAINDTIKGSTVNKNPEQRLFLNLTYKFSDRLNAGIMADYSHSLRKIDTSYSAAYGIGTGNLAENSRARLNYYEAGAFINYKPLKNLSNTLWFEYAYDTITANYNNNASFPSTTGQPFKTSDSTTIQPRSKRYVIRNQLKYEFVRTKKISADLSLVFTYLRQDAEESRRISARFNGGGWSLGRSWYLFKEKIASLNPTFNITLPQIISMYVGVDILFSKKLFERVDKKDKISFFAGLNADFVRLMKLQRTLSSLGLSFHYADLPQNNSNNQWLGSAYNPSQFSPRSVFSFILPNTNPYRLTIAKQQFITVNLNAASASDRFQFIAGWSRLRWERIYAIRVFPGQNYFIPGLETRQGLSFEFAGKVIDQSQVKWKNSFSLFFPETKIDQVGINSGETVDKSTLRAGMQNKIDYKNFFLQVNMLLDMDHAYYLPNTYPPKAEKHNDFNLNYVLLGYRPAISKTSRFKDICVFAQLRNVFVSKKLRDSYQSDHYGGIGVNLRF